MNNTEIRRPVIGITMGDPAGNGPELCVQALLHKAIYEECRLSWGMQTLSKKRLCCWAIRS